MKLNTRLTSTRMLYCVHELMLALLAVFIMSVFISSKVGAIGVSNELAKLTEDEYIKYSQNDIYFVAPDCVSTGGPSSICGDTPKEMYWSALSQYIDDPVKVAGVMGNLAAEGLFQPVLWEFAYTNDDGTLKASWDRLYNCGNDDCPFGVGAFGFTYHLGKYLHAVNDENPDLLKYFQNSVEYSLGDADELMKKIGKDDFARLVEFEMRYAIETWEPETTERYLNQKFDSPSDAAYWWMDQWERPGIRTESERRSAAGKLYDEFKNFTCTPSVSSSTSHNAETTGLNSDITLIGDSIAVQAEAELQAKFPGAFMSKVGSRHTDSKGACDNDESGLRILEKIVSGSGTVANQHVGVKECVELRIDSNSLKESIVWELGTNTSGADRKNIEDVIKKIGKKKLFLVTPYNGDDEVRRNGVNYKEETDAIANLYRDIAEQYDNVYLVDWNKKVRDSESKYITRDDGMVVHPTAEGRQLLADLIEEAVGSTANCVMTDYKDKAYLKRLENLSSFHQSGGYWKDHTLCPSGGGFIKKDGCGVMSMFGMYYMFSGEGLEDEGLFNGITAAAQKDGFITLDCTSTGTTWGKAVEEYTGMTPETLWDGLGSYTDDKWTQLVDALEQGKKVLIGTAASGCGGKSQFAGCQHALFLDHYDKEKDAVLLFDPSIGERRAALVQVGPTGDIKDGVYINRRAMEEFVDPYEAVAVTYYGQACSTICDNEDVNGLVEGGMTYEQAVKFMQSYVDEASKQKPGDYGVGSSNGTVIGPGWVSDAGCSDGALNNCVAFSQWFVNNYTTAGLTFGTNHGKGYVDTMISGGFTDGGTTPRAYAVFSTGFEDLYGHTGVVLGINKEKNEIYIGEAGCGGYDAERGWPGVHVKDLGEYTSGAYRYAYTDGKLLGGKTIKSMLDSF